jgi:FAD/FMN-containing dehydrogenase/Fe-S oxidoreductase
VPGKASPPATIEGVSSSAVFPILDQPPRTSATSALEQALRSAIRGEVRFDPAARALYATDASNYRQPPIGLVIPEDADDVAAAIEVCRAHNAPILARGGGTSLAGQTCNTAVVFDYSKKMRRILALAPEQKLATVEPGIVLDRLREAAEEYELTFAPDPATHSRCTLGGMLGNNSCGTHALMGGKTVDNTHSLDLLLYDGTRMTVGATSEAELHAIILAGGRRGNLYAGLKSVRDRYASEIRARFPKIPRRVSGYNLDELLPENGFHVARALVGSEGTCATILSATLELKDSPQHRRLVTLTFADQFIAADHVPQVLEFGPIGLEGMDRRLIEMTRRKKLALDDLGLLPDGGGHLLVEFGAWTAEDALAQAERFVAAVSGWAARPVIRYYAGQEAVRVWRIREQSLGATVFVPNEPHGWEGWEDAAVRPDLLGSYLRQIQTLMQRYGYWSAMYGHFGQGCVHMRINFDLESAAGIAKYRAFIDEAADIVIAHGGSLSGEHGDGQSRAALLPKMFGPEIMQAFQEFKTLWDPENRMNPGKLVAPAGARLLQPDELLRLGDGYKSATPETYFQFPNDHGSFAEATMRCVGVGACRKEGSGTMCPSYMATREEEHSTRGRAHLLWELMQGDVLAHGWGNEQVKHALDLCLSCKACKTECPVNVDVATYKAEFLAHYYEEHPRSVRDYAFGRMDRWARLAHVLPGLSPVLANAVLRLPGAARIARSLLQIAPQRTLPRFAVRSYQSGLARTAPQQAGQAVVLWPDTWNNYFHPQALTAAKRVLIAAGLAPQTPREHVCCGRPLYDFGMLLEARAYLREILERFAAEIDAGLPFLFLEPSCASVFRDELLNFFPEDPRAQRLAAETWLFADALVKYAPGWRAAPSPQAPDVLVHGHCHHKALGKMDAELALLRATGAKVTLLDSGCCGMAGPFGFEQEKYQVSQQLGERVLLPAVRSAHKDTVIVTDGFSCREQIAQGSTRRAVHAVEVLAAGL